MADYLVNKKIDYLVFRTENVDFTKDYYITKEEGYSPIKMYDKMQVYDCGMVVHSPINRTFAHSYVVCSGDALENMRLNHTDVSLLKMLQYSKPQYSRIDLAVTSWRDDGLMHELIPHVIAQLANAGWLDSRLAVDNHVAKPDLLVETAYIGSRKSRNRLFRAYDKGVEMDLDRHKIVRYELQTNKNPNKVVKSVREGADIGALIRTYVDFPQIPLWCKIMGNTVHSVHHDEPLAMDERTKRLNKNASRWQWLIDSCAKTVATAMAEDFQLRFVDPSDSGNVDQFSRAISKRYNELITNKLDKT